MIHEIYRAIKASLLIINKSTNILLIKVPIYLKRKRELRSKAPENFSGRLPRTFPEQNREQRELKNLKVRNREDKI